MTIEEAKRRAELYSALAEGKIIQVQNSYTDEWRDLDINKIYGFINGFNYRIKPEPKYRPFETQEECWNEMHKHPDFGWVVYDKIRHSICDVTPDEITILYEGDSLGIDFKTGLERVTFTDGTPFGIKEE